MDKQTAYLIDEIIRFSIERELSLVKATRLLAEFAKQRLPEYRLEKEQRSSERKIEDQIRSSDSRTIVMRVPIRSWVHEVQWPYYPEYHVIGRAYENYAFPVRANVENWKPTVDPKLVYLDDLFYDPDEEIFWQPEPFLKSIEVSATTYKHIRSDRLGKVRGTTYTKVSPEIMSEFIEARSGRPDYIVKSYGRDVSWFGRPIGSKGWKERMSGVVRYWSLRRKTDWKIR